MNKKDDTRIVFWVFILTMRDILIIAPCTGNTLAKIAVGIADTLAILAYLFKINKKKHLIFQQNRYIINKT